jgi:hypothetical protein
MQEARTTLQTEKCHRKRLAFFCLELLADPKCPFDKCASIWSGVPSLISWEMPSPIIPSGGRKRPWPVVGQSRAQLSRNWNCAA